MEWFSGNIEEAVRTSKEKNVIFVVFVDGNNDESAPFAALVNDASVAQRLKDTSKYLAIRVESTSETYKMFAQIYRLVPVPSMFLIGHNGQPLEIIASNVKTANELLEKIQKAEEMFFKKTDDITSAPSSSAAPVAAAKPPAVDKKPASENKEDLDMQKLKEERRREKAEDEEARRRVLEQIKLDRLRRQDQEPVVKKTPTEPALAPVRSMPDMTRIQFRKPTGETVIDTFKSEGPFGDVWKYAKASLGVKDFVLATSMPPRREFSADHSQQTLVELNLAPSAVLLVIPLTKPSVIGTAVSSRGGVVATVTGFLFTLFWLLMNPLLGLWNHITGKAPVKREEPPAQESEDPGANISSEVLQKRNLARYNLGPSASSSTASTQNKSNIHRLRDYDSDDDDKKTYNGNSTQQM